MSHPTQLYTDSKSTGSLDIHNEDYDTFEQRIHVRNK